MHYQDFVPSPIKTTFKVQILQKFSKKLFFSKKSRMSDIQTSAGKYFKASALFKNSLINRSAVFTVIANEQISVVNVNQSGGFAYVGHTRS